MQRRRSLLLYGSLRYFLLLLVCAIGVGIGTLTLIQYSASKEQREAMEQVVRELGAKLQAHGGALPEELLERELVEQTERFGLTSRPIFFVLDSRGRLVQQSPLAPRFDLEELRGELAAITQGAAGVVRPRGLGGEIPYVGAAVPLVSAAGTSAGYALFVQPKSDVLRGLQAFREIRLFGTGLIVLVGWLAIYWITRRLVQPIRHAAEASRQIVAGNYDIQLSSHSHPEKEIHELLQSFREMADRLKRLEALRTQLLAGVTHELKTPIASISGLLQAVRDSVVEGEEAKLFLDNGLKHTRHLQKMVEDLLDFHAFASNTVTICREPFHMRKALHAIVRQWNFSRPRHSARLELGQNRGSAAWEVDSDPGRVEQVAINLLRNAADAMPQGGTILVRLLREAESVRIEVCDCGRGVPEEERERIFEPFYRGEAKKRYVRGLGLGLSFSRLIARALGGELELARSDSQGSVFALTVPVARAQDVMPDAAVQNR
ncbi:HAMP domain-containing histidine kinase [Paenibacillus sp. IB182496]|uniref:histidine kinase n=1 Tax=Paenibacillus sabuli TaxID=2772509 RepID=A0A927GQD0_9BACL|nr:HAMP domain-containing sensor histidine kinase [Paenibacillus sabuli]MBD2843632.1 HAMP domain-containing histidine kinase [Paenibacillus sabuli]